MKNTTTIIMLALVLLSCTPAEENNTIGAILPLTGSGSASGISAQEGMLLAVKELNNQGRPTTLFFEDSKTNPAEGATAFHSLVAQHEPRAIISGLSAISQALAPLAEENKIPLIATIATSPIKNEWTTRYYSGAADEARAIRAIILTLNLTNPGLLFLDDDFGKSIARELTQEINFSEPYLVATSDFRTNLLKLKNADGLIIVGYGSHIANAAKQTREIGFLGPLITSSTAASHDLRHSLAITNITVYAGVAPLTNTAFQEAFISEYGHEPDMYAAAGYDSVKLIDSALSRAGPSGLLASLQNITTFSGALGTTTRNGGEFSFSLEPARIENEQITLLAS